MTVHAAGAPADKILPEMLRTVGRAANPYRGQPRSVPIPGRQREAPVPGVGKDGE